MIRFEMDTKSGMGSSFTLGRDEHTAEKEMRLFIKWVIFMIDHSPDSAPSIRITLRDRTTEVSNG